MRRPSPNRIVVHISDAIRSSILPLVTCLVMLLWAPDTFGNSKYQKGVADYVGIPSDAVACGTCHDPPGKGGEDRNQPFYLTLESSGVVVGVFSTLIPALDKMAADKTDSDGDSADDLAELKSGTNPNDPSSTPRPDDGGGAGGGGTSGSPIGPAGTSGAETSDSGRGGSTAGSDSSNGGGSSQPKKGSDATQNSTNTGCAYSERRGVATNGVFVLLCLGLMLLRRTRLLTDHVRLESPECHHVKAPPSMAVRFHCFRPGILRR
jgi:hypothetical protein